MHLRDQPLPEIRRLRVRVIHPERGHSYLHPEHHHLVDLRIDIRGIIIKIQRINILVLLRRILRIRDRAVRLRREEIPMLYRPRVIRCRLQRQINRNLQPQLLRILQQGLKIINRPQLWVHGIMPTLGRTHSPRGSHIIRLRHERVILPLPVHLTDRVNRREIHRIKPHLRHPFQCPRRGLKRAMDRIPVRIHPTRRPGEQLIPGIHQRIPALHQHRIRLPRGQQLP